jgi:hypothetical protein
MKILYFLIFFLMLSACTNLDDAGMEERNTFMHFYEGANSYTAAAAEITSDGYIIVGTVLLVDGTTTDSKIVVIRTDPYGQRIGDEILISGGTASGVKVSSNGYIVIGDSIQYNLNSEQIPELVNNWSRLIQMDNNGTITSDNSYARKITLPGDTTHVDFHGDAVTFDDQGNIVTLGTFKAPGSHEFAYVAALNPTTLDTLWRKGYDYIDRDYTNAKSVFYNNAGNVVWGTSVQNEVSSFSRSYLSIPVIKDSSVFVNSDYYGENTDQSFLIEDMQPSPLGYGVIGTYSQADGTKGNLFFIRVDNSGNFRTGTARYFDGIESQNNEPLADSTVSNSEDTGNAITATRDGGYVLAGTITTTPQRGNGGKDIWLIKIDGFGNPIWNKLIGSSTDETVSSIRETADGGLLICGTKTLGALSSIFLIKTDSNGELKN